MRPSVRPSWEQAKRAVRGAILEREWAICLLDQSLDELLEGQTPAGRAFKPTDQRTYWADPFVVADRSDTWIFVEEFRRRRGLGDIVALKVTDGAVTSHGTVLTGDHHISFPQVHRFRSGWIATVETCDPDARVHQFDEPGQRWRATEWRLPADLIDPQLTRMKDGRWRLTATSRLHSGYGPVTTWISAGQEPVHWTVIDVRDHGLLARGGGTSDAERGLRAVQDCTENYGQALSLRNWPSGTAVRDLRGPDVITRPEAGWLGLHTCSWTTTGSTVVVDLWRRRFQPLSPLDRFREFRRDPCRRVGGVE